VTGDVSVEFFNEQDRSVKASATVNAYPYSYSTLPTCFEGYLIAGDDDASGTDYYYTKVDGVSWGCQGTYVYPTDIKVAPESSITFTAYDDGTKEDTWNITVGTTKVTSAELKIESGSDSCIGNPGLSRPVAVCINGSTSTLSKFNEIRPAVFDSSMTAPDFLTAETSVLKCYVLPTEALCDGNFWQGFWVIDPVSDPGVTDKVSICVLDKNYYQDDNNVYRVGWEDSSSFEADSDIGIALACKDLNFT
jgi:hypothetical protein